jgi:hypothetical protein
MEYFISICVTILLFMLILVNLEQMLVHLKNYLTFKCFHGQFMFFNLNNYIIFLNV